MALISPQSDELALGLEFVNSGQVEAFVHSAQVSQIENVVELQWGTWQFFQAGVVQLQSGLRDKVHRALDVIVKLAQMSLQKS